MAALLCSFRVQGVGQALRLPVVCCVLQAGWVRTCSNMSKEAHGWTLVELLLWPVCTHPCTIRVAACAARTCIALQVVSSDTQKGESGRAFTAYAIKVTGHDGATSQILRRFRYSRPRPSPIAMSFYSVEPSCLQSGFS